ncbi:MAG: hypothetical protein ACE5Q6_10235, partial [Dehalococcoidia bacterium]
PAPTSPFPSNVAASIPGIQGALLPTPTQEEARALGEQARSRSLTPPMPSVSVVTPGTPGYLPGGEAPPPQDGSSAKVTTPEEAGGQVVGSTDAPPTLGEIRALWLADQISDAEALEMIKGVMGYLPGGQSNAANVMLQEWKDQRTGGNAKAAFVPSPAPAPAPTPDQGDTGSFFGGTTGPDTRADIYATQLGDELRRRLIANAFGTDLTPLGSRTAQYVLNKFIGQDPLIEFADPSRTLGQRFQAFAGGQRPTQQALSESLEGLLELAGTNAKAFQEFVPDFRTAARTGLQPTLMGINPRLAQGYESRLLGNLQTQMAQMPEQFQNASAANLAALLSEYQRRGFIPGRR